MAWTIGNNGPPIDFSPLAQNAALRRQYAAQPNSTLSALGAGLGQGVNTGTNLFIQDLLANKREQRYLDRLDKRDAAALAREQARNEAIAQRRLEEQQRAQLYELQQEQTRQSEEWIYNAADRMAPLDSVRWQDAQNELAAVWNDPKTTIEEKLQAREQYSAEVIQIGAKYKPQSREQQAQQMIIPLPQLGEGVMGQITYRNNKPQIDVLEETTPAYKAKVQADMLQAQPPLGPQGPSTMPIGQSPYAHLAEYYPPGTEVFVNPKTQEPKFIQPPKMEGVSSGGLSTKDLLAIDKQAYDNALSQQPIEIGTGKHAVPPPEAVAAERDRLRFDALNSGERVAERKKLNELINQNPALGRETAFRFSQMIDAAKENGTTPESEVANIIEAKLMFAEKVPALANDPSYKREIEALLLVKEALEADANSR